MDMTYAEPPDDDPPDEAQAEPSDRRRLPRLTADFGVGMTGGGLALSGQAVNLSRQGLGVRLDAWPAGGGGHESGAQRIRAAFALGVVLDFRGRDVRVPARLARLDMASKDRAPPPLLGLHFARPLAEDEWARLSSASAARTSPRAAVRPVRRGSVPLVLTVVGAESDGPLTAEVHGVGFDPSTSDFVEGLVAETPLESVVRRRFADGNRPARIQSGSQILWVGTAGLGSLRSTSKGLVGRFLTSPALTPAVRAWVDGA